MTEAVLLKRLQKKDPEALNQLTTRYQSYICAVLSNVLSGVGSSSDVDELFNDVILAAWQNACQIEVGSLKPWLGTVARNRAKSWLRTRRELPMDLDELELPDTAEGLEEQVLRRELAQAVRKAVDSLKAKDRDIFLRYYFYLQSTERIARELGIAESSVRSRLSRGREVLKKQLEKEVRP